MARQGAEALLAEHARIQCPNCYHSMHYFAHQDIYECAFCDLEIRMTQKAKEASA
jgi:ribosomal protein L37AE/L43A